jgi:hypothetical protein
MAMRSRRLARTPAMAAGLTTYSWSVREPLSYPCAPATRQQIEPARAFYPL